MNKDNAKDYLPLVQALAEGKVIQESWTTTPRETWRDYDGRGADGSVIPLDSIPLRHLRIKPEPRKAWVWWPERFEDLSLEIFEGESSARNYMAQHGGHITEVTE